MEVKEAFKIVYRSRLTMKDALAAMDERTDWGWAATLFRNFVYRVASAQPPYNRSLVRAGSERLKYRRCLVLIRSLTPQQATGNALAKEFKSFPGRLVEIDMAVSAGIFL